ncbi:hypothetical protein PoB_002392500 [Plakobranchus ocellatus]|uniref:Uncharacterized protein n=1 Tax=Plakobranchus ocellatus TaxID=259542 RepID=A0AAV3ZS34_9GAST|nr:hypothetical protein PoB_002392500 [Plakobranchus ocellatus]
MNIDQLFETELIVNLSLAPPLSTLSHAIWPLEFGGPQLCKFPHLSELTINYEYLTDGLLLWLATSGEDRTIHLNLVSWLTSSNRPGVSVEAWSALADSKRDVRVYLILQNIRSVSEVHYSILRPEIPMHRLDLVGVAALEPQETKYMVDLLHHIADSYGNTLAGLRLWSDNYMCADIEDAILCLLRKTPKLGYLDLHMELHCKMISVLCDLLKNHVINLHTLRLARSLTNFMEFEQFRGQIQACYPMLKVNARSRISALTFTSERRALQTTVPGMSMSSLSLTMLGSWTVRMRTISPVSTLPLRYHLPHQTHHHRLPRPQTTTTTATTYRFCEAAHSPEFQEGGEVSDMPFRARKVTPSQDIMSIYDVDRTVCAESFDRGRFLELN